MKHVFRFVAEESAQGAWVLGPEEAHHALKVLRLKSGDACEVTNGRGRWASGVFTDLVEKRALVTVSAAHDEPAASHPLTVALGSLKPSTFDDLLPTLVELGVDTIQVILQEQAAKARVKDSVRERWQRILQAACKQSKRARFPALETHASWDEWISATKREDIVILDPAANVSCLEHSWVSGGRVLLCGGEKGFSDEEDSRLTALGLPRVRLGGAVMRAETACLAATAIFNARRPTR